LTGNSPAPLEGVTISGTPPLLRGLVPEDPFLETYLVRPGGATVFGLKPDERVTVIDREGGQVAEHFGGLGLTQLFNIEGGIDAWSDQIDNSVPKY